MLLLLQRFIGAGYGGRAVGCRRARRLADCHHQYVGLRRSGHLSVEDVFLVGAGAVEGLVAAIIGLHDGASWRRNTKSPCKS